MPTYQNDGNQVHQVENLAGNPVTINPGETIETYRHYSLAGLVKTADTPYYNPHTALTKLSFSNADDEKTHVLNAETKKVRIQKVSSGLTVDVYLQAKANTPPVLLEHDADDGAADIEINGMATQLILDPDDAGFCQVVEFK